MYMYVYVCIGVYRYLYIGLSRYVCLGMCTCMYMIVHVCICMWSYVCMCGCMSSKWTAASLKRCRYVAELVAISPKWTDIFMYSFFLKHNITNVLWYFALPLGRHTRWYQLSPLESNIFRKQAPPAIHWDSWQLVVLSDHFLFLKFSVVAGLLLHAAPRSRLSTLLERTDYCRW